MCMALPGGHDQGEPRSRWRQSIDWIVFSVLLSGFLATGLWRWLVHRLATRRMPIR